MLDYRVQSGDSLFAIAHQYQVTAEAIQAQNAIIKDVNHIETGWLLKIPANNTSKKQPGESAPADFKGAEQKSMPVAKSTDSDSSTEVAAKPCQTELKEVIHVTGASDGEWCMALPEAAADALYQEMAEMDDLMAAFKTAQDEKPDQPGAGDTKKREWMIKAAEKGVIAPANDEEKKEPSKASRLKSRVAALDKQIIWYDDYDPGYFFSFVSDSADKREEILTKAKQRRLEHLRSERKALQNQLESEEKQAKGVKGGVKASDFSKRSNTSEAGLVEIMVFSRPGRWHYVRKEVLRRLVAGYASIQYIRKTRNISSALENKKGTAGALLGKIKNDLKTDAQKSAIGNIEAKFAEAKQDYYLLGEEHTAFKWSAGNGATPPETNIQTSAEAQLMRFAMQASAGVNAFDLSEGQIDVGVKASAAMALAEAEAKLAEISIPNEAGWDCRFTYKNRSGELCDLAFGAFKLTGEVTLNCFVGGRISGEANARVSAGAPTFLLSDKKTVEPSHEAGLAVSGNAFAGAEASGAVAGKFKWVHPDEQYKDNANWQELLKIEAGGTVAGGIGAELDFELRLMADGVYMFCKGKLVFGPGAGGSFGTMVDVAAVWDLCKTVYEVLEASDYEFLSNLTADLFEQWHRAVYLALTDQVVNFGQLLSSPADQFLIYYGGRNDLESEARQLAGTIIAEAKRVKDTGGFEEMTFEGLPYTQLPPETLGMICYTLSETFAFSWEERQETALLIVVSTIKSWRKFLETMEHMTRDGGKTNAMNSLERICAMLDDARETDQLSGFHEWISRLETGFTPSVAGDLTLAWRPVAPSRKYARVSRKIAAFEAQYGKNVLT